MDNFFIKIVQFVREKMYFLILSKLLHIHCAVFSILFRLDIKYCLQRIFKYVQKFLTADESTFSSVLTV